MVYKSKQNWKDLAEGSNHKGLTRRDFLARGMATGAISLTIPKMLGMDLVANAWGAASSTTCTPPPLAKGAIAQIFSSGGPTMGARFISPAQLAGMNATMAANYGISGVATNLVTIGKNVVIDSTSPFGAVLLAGPPGYTGGAAAWRTNVLSKISGGGHLGPFNADDGAGVDTGLIGAVGSLKSSQMGKDLRVGVQNALATWANGMPAASLRGGAALTSTALASTFSMTPAAAGLTTSTELTNVGNAANAISQALAPIFGTAKRTGTDTLSSQAGCALYGNAALASPTYGSSLFTASGITALTSKLTVANLTQSEQAQLAAYYQSAAGVAGGVITQFNGRDYHGQSATTISNADVEEARSFVMWLAACDAAQAKGAMIYTSNGQAIASGVTAGQTVTINGTATTVNVPAAVGDAGGAYNAGLILFYDPAGGTPNAKYTYRSLSGSGNVVVDPNIGPGAPTAMAGLYLSALAFIAGGTPPAAAVDAMKKAGVTASSSSIMVF